MNGASQNKVETISLYSARLESITGFFLVATISFIAKMWYRLAPQYNKAKSVGRKKHAAVLRR